MEKCKLYSDGRFIVASMIFLLVVNDRRALFFYFNPIFMSVFNVFFLVFVHVYFVHLY